jgi:hypothetical protein
LDENAGGETWNMISNRGQTLKGSAVGEPLQSSMHVNVLLPGLSLRSNPGLKLANAFGVKTCAEISQRLRCKTWAQLANAFCVKTCAEISQRLRCKTWAQLANRLQVEMIKSQTD